MCCFYISRVLYIFSGLTVINYSIFCPYFFFYSQSVSFAYEMRQKMMFDEK